jgi:hypothetical protein
MTQKELIEGQVTIKIWQRSGYSIAFPAATLVPCALDL